MFGGTVTLNVPRNVREKDETKNQNYTHRLSH